VAVPKLAAVFLVPVRVALVPQQQAHLPALRVLALQQLVLRGRPHPVVVSQEARQQAAGFPVLLPQPVPHHRKGPPRVPRVLLLLPQRRRLLQLRPNRPGRSTSIRLVQRRWPSTGMVSSRRAFSVLLPQPRRRRR
jgi:hypothetical protein